MVGVRTVWNKVNQPLRIHSCWFSFHLAVQRSCGGRPTWLVQSCSVSWAGQVRMELDFQSRATPKLQCLLTSAKSCSNNTCMVWFHSPSHHFFLVLNDSCLCIMYTRFHLEQYIWSGTSWLKHSLSPGSYSCDATSYHIDCSSHFFWGCEIFMCLQGQHVGVVLWTQWPLHSSRFS